MTGSSRGRSAVVAILIVVLAFSGCNRKARTDGTRPVPSSTSGAAVPGSGGGSTTPGAGGRKGASPGSIAGLQLEVDRLARKGDTVQLNIAVRNVGDKRVSHEAFVFADPEYNFVNQNNAADVSGAMLVDLAARKEYFPLLDANGSCLCSKIPLSYEPGQSAQLSATFPAPPESVRNVDVVLPRFVPVEDVPISK